LINIRKGVDNRELMLVALKSLQEFAGRFAAQRTFQCEAERKRISLKAWRCWKELREHAGSSRKKSEASVTQSTRSVFKEQAVNEGNILHEKKGA
jgi:hypothetical protein